MDRALDRFPNKNRNYEFRIEARARSETNNFKSLWIALLIGFQIRIAILNLESKPERDLKQIIIKVFRSRSWSVSNIRIELLCSESKTRARSETNNYKSLSIALLIGFQNKNRTAEFRIQARARSEANNFKSLWIALLIGFQMRIEILNLESKPERDLKQIILKVFGSRSWSISENKLMF